MSEKRKCRLCGMDIPGGRRGSSRYCSEEHYREAKRRRTHRQNQCLKELHDKKVKNEVILSGLYLTQKLNIQLNLEILHRAGLDLGFVTKETMDVKKNIWKHVGQYAYQINPNNENVEIWKAE